MTQFRPQGPTTPEAVAAANRKPEPRPLSQDLPGAWQDTLVTVIRSEIDKGMIVRVRLPGSKSPLLIEDAGHYGDFVALADPVGGWFFVGSMEGVVVMSQPLVEPGQPAAPARPLRAPPSAGKPYWMTVDGDD